jgi:HPt (histidine-containing phosphotransfer) domain-containing protein
MAIRTQDGRETIMGTISRNGHASERELDASVMTDSPRNWNPENALARVEGDECLLRELIQLFIDDYPKTMQELRVAIAQGDTSTAERHAHTLKGSAANFEAAPVVTAGLRLETSAYRKDLSNVAREFQDLESALGQLHGELAAYLLT